MWARKPPEAQTARPPFFRQWSTPRLPQSADSWRTGGHHFDCDDRPVLVLGHHVDLTTGPVTVLAQVGGGSGQASSRSCATSSNWRRSGARGGVGANGLHGFAPMLPPSDTQTHGA